MDRTSERLGTKQVLKALESFKNDLEHYLHLIIPALVNLLEGDNFEIQKFTMKTIARLCTLNISDYASWIIHPTLRILEATTIDQAKTSKDTPPPTNELRKEAVTILCEMVYQLGTDYTIFVPLANRVVSKLPPEPTTTRYRNLVNQLIKGQPLEEPETLAIDKHSSGSESDKSFSNPTSVVPITQLDISPIVQESWETSQRSTKEDWSDWLRRFMTGVLKGCPSVALRYCTDLSDHFPLVRELFNACFISCWLVLNKQSKQHFETHLTKVLTSDIPPEILQTLLNLTEFIDHEIGIQRSAFPLDIKTTGQLAFQCHAYAKALHYKEELFFRSPSNQLIEELISLNNLLGQPAAASGLFKYAQGNNNLTIQESWYEQLHQWPEALQVWQSRSEKPEDYIDKKVLCLHSLGQWKELRDLANQVWKDLRVETKRTIAPKAANAAWNLSSWSDLLTFTEEIPSESLESPFFRAILSIIDNQFKKARKFIEQGRNILDPELTVLFGVSFIIFWAMQMLTQFSKRNLIRERINKLSDSNN